jgi:hypothetical protein
MLPIKAIRRIKVYCIPYAISKLSADVLQYPSEQVHQTDIAVQSGQKVTGDTTIGYSTTVLPRDNSRCGLHTDAEHVHIALLKGGSGQAGSYESPVGESFCGHKVARLSQGGDQVILQGLTTTPGQQFSVPC